LRLMDKTGVRSRSTLRNCALTATVAESQVGACGKFRELLPCLFCRTISGLTWSRGARTAEMLLTEPRMRVNRPGGEPSGLLIGAGVKILGFSLERRRPTPAALPLIADGNSAVWTARRKWRRIQRILAFPLDMTSLDANDGILAPFAKRLGIHDDRGWRPPSQSDLPTREVD
jgi:hypothetical protein